MSREEEEGGEEKTKLEKMVKEMKRKKPVRADRSLGLFLALFPTHGERQQQPRKRRLYLCRFVLFALCALEFLHRVHFMTPFGICFVDAVAVIVVVVVQLNLIKNFVVCCSL